MVSRLGDCEALVRSAAKECLAKAGGLGSQPENLEVLNRSCGKLVQPCLAVVFFLLHHGFNGMNSISRQIPNKNQHGNATQLAVMWPQVLWCGGN